MIHRGPFNIIIVGLLVVFNQFEVFFLKIMSLNSIISFNIVSLILLKTRYFKYTCNALFIFILRHYWVLYNVIIIRIILIRFTAHRII